MPWLRLIRWKNLVIIFLTQLLAWWCVVVPEVPVVLNLTNFMCLSLSTILIAAAGYVINDYFDIKIDSVNKPEKMVLEKTIPRKQAITSHFLLNVIALVLAAYVAAWAHHYEWLLLQALCIALLWFYSTHFKRQYITGNVVVAWLTALTVLVLLLYEPALSKSPKHFTIIGGLPAPEWVLLVYAYFAFVLTWIREIVKDMEDQAGDAQEGCLTMPIKNGLQYASRFCAALSVAAIIPLCIATVLLYARGQVWLPSYILLLLVMPLMLWTYTILKRTGTPFYHLANERLKLIMISGIGSLIIYHLQLD